MKILKALAAVAALGAALSIAPPKQDGVRVKESRPAKLTKAEMASITAGNPPGAVNGLVNSNKNGSTANNGPPPYPNR